MVEEGSAEKVMGAPEREEGVWGCAPKDPPDEEVGRRCEWPCRGPVDGWPVPGTTAIRFAPPPESSESVVGLVEA